MGGLTLYMFGIGRFGHIICMIHMQPQSDQMMEQKCLGEWVARLGVVVLKKKGRMNRFS